MPDDAVVILGGGEGQIPALLAAQTMQFKAIVLDPNSRCMGAALADHFACIDLSDEEAAFRELDACPFTIRGAITLAADFPTPLMAKVNERYKLHGVHHDVALACTNKCTMRGCLEEGKVTCPHWFAVASTDEAQDACRKLKALGVRGAVFKPLDSSGGRGITALGLDEKFEEQVVLAYNRACGYNRKSPMSAKIMVEELVEGEEISVETLSLGIGNARVIAITQKSTTGPPNFVEVAHVQPCDSPILVEAEHVIRSTALGAVSALAMTYCAGHVELKARRCPVLPARVA